jgi:hypothetical protein
VTRLLEDGTPAWALNVITEKYREGFYSYDIGRLGAERHWIYSNGIEDRRRVKGSTVRLLPSNNSEALYFLREE